MNKLFITLITVLLINTAYADEKLSLPYQFKNGDIADADQVNEMFNSIQDNINDNLITMSDYAAAIGSIKTFQLTNQTIQYIFVTTEANKETWEYQDRTREYILIKNDIGVFKAEYKEYNSNDTLTMHLLYEPSIITAIINEPKEIGKSYGGGCVVKKIGNVWYGTETAMYTILAVENVTVPAGYFFDCVKIHYNNQYDYVAWYAEGVGMIKRIGIDGIMELTDVQ